MTSGKPLVWLHGEVKTPPFSRVARLEAGFLLRRLQNGELINMPVSRPMPEIGRNFTSCGSMTAVLRGESFTTSTLMLS
jgi:hypothetical protein